MLKDPSTCEFEYLKDPSARNSISEDFLKYRLPDDEAGEIPAACVVKKEGATETEDDMIKFVASQVANYKKVRVLHFVASIPKSLSGKILRRLVRDNLLGLTKTAAN